MKDFELFRLIISTLRTIYDDQTMVIKQQYQPEMQGIVNGKALYLFKLYDAYFGSPLKSEELTQDETEFVHTETQQIASYFQINAIVPQNASADEPETASDYLNDVCLAIKSDAFVSAIQKVGVGLLRPPEVRNPYFKDDTDRFQASPSLVFALTHKRSKIFSVPVITSLNGKIIAV